MHEAGWCCSSPRRMSNLLLRVTTSPPHSVFSCNAAAFCLAASTDWLQAMLLKLRALQIPPATSRSTYLSGSASQNSGNRGGHSTRNGYARSRGEQSIIAINNADKDFKGKEEIIGVLGLPIENYLKFEVGFLPVLSSFWQIFCKIGQLCQT